MKVHCADTLASADNPRVAAKKAVSARDNGRSGLRGLLKTPSPWTLIGLALVLLGLAPYIAGFKLPVLGELQENGVYKYITGSALLGYILLQWKLFAHRESGEKPAWAAKWYRRHKILGVLAPVPFVAHASTFGHGSLMLLSIVFFLVVISGLLNQDLLCIKSPVFWQAWIVFHVGFAFAMYALVALHVWTALSFSS